MLLLYIFFVFVVIAIAVLRFSCLLFVSSLVFLYYCSIFFLLLLRSLFIFVIASMKRSFYIFLYKFLCTTFDYNKWINTLAEYICIHIHTIYQYMGCNRGIERMEIVPNDIE